MLAEVLARSEWIESVRGRAARGPLRDASPRSLEDALKMRLDRAPAHGLQRALNLDAQLNLVDDMLHYFDRTSMAYSLEVRVPFLDHRLVELCAAMPASTQAPWPDDQGDPPRRRARRGASRCARSAEGGLLQWQRH